MGKDLNVGLFLHVQEDEIHQFPYSLENLRPVPLEEFHRPGETGGGEILPRPHRPLRVVLHGEHLSSPAGKAPGKTYDLVLLCHGGKPETARATMARIAATFKVLVKPKKPKVPEPVGTKPKPVR